MMCEKLQRIKCLLIGRHIYTEISIRVMPTNRNCSETQDAPKFMHKLPNYSYISLCLPASTKLSINETEHALRLLVSRIRSSGTCFVYFDIGSNVLKKSEFCGGRRQVFRSKWQQLAAVQNHAFSQVKECILHNFLELTWEESFF